MKRGDREKDRHCQTALSGFRLGYHTSALPCAPGCFVNGRAIVPWPRSGFVLSEVQFVISDSRGEFRVKREIIEEKLGFRWVYKAPDKKQPDFKKTIFRAKKVLAGLVHDMAFLEGNPFTFPEVQTLLDGVTVGGHKLSDETQILNTAEAWKLLFRFVETGGFAVSKDVFCSLHQVAARGEALALGEFRDGDVGISGTEYRPPKCERLGTLFEEGILALQCIEEEYERAFAFFLFGSLQQFFWDGNKRTSRLMMAGELLMNGLDIASIPASKKLEFNQKMIRFYDSKDGSEMMEFLSGCII